MPQANEKKQTKAFSSDITVIEGERAVSAVISTTAVDRDHEVLIPQGCNWKDFQANPVIFLNHNYADWFGTDATIEKLPVGKCTALTRDKETLSFKMTFAQRPADYPAGKEWVPDTLLSLYQQGVMRAFSVGFVPIETRAATDKDLLDYGADCRGVISKWKLLEVSCVPLPANQEAVALAVSKGLLTADRAKAMEAAARDNAERGTLNAEQKAADGSKMGTCSKCDKEFPLEDLQDVDGEFYCDDCMAESKSIAAMEAEGAPPVGTGSAAGVPEPKRMKFFVPAAPVLPVALAPDVKGMIDRGIDVALAKKRGAIYLFV